MNVPSRYYGEVEKAIGQSGWSSRYVWKKGKNERALLRFFEQVRWTEGHICEKTKYITHYQ